MEAVSNILENLKDDAMYYGDYGKRFLSNSDIGTLLSNPKLFGVSRPENKSLAEGRLFHQLILETDKAVSFPTIDVSSRNTKAYKDYIAETGLDFILLEKEADSIKELTKTMLSNLTFYDMIYMDGNEYEVPQVKEIHGKLWKGKADIVSQDVLIDIKTTSDISSFRWSAKKYNYDSQCYIYQELFGKPLVFLVIDKLTKQLGIFKPSTEFVEGGQQKVLKAIEVYDRFFGDNAVESIDSYFIEETI